jgi:exodeoxyribonuclease V gamma subunit
MQSMANGFAILRSNRFEGLRELLVEWLRSDPLAPLENEVVLVQNRGMGQWLKMALAEPEALGIAAAIDTPLPAQFLWQANRTVLAD